VAKADPFQLNSLMASEAGRAHLNQVRAQQANSLIQNVLSNPVGQHQSQIPPQLQQQLNLQQQQQLATQIAQQQMGLQGFPQGMMQAQQHQTQTQEQQLAQQQLQQMQMRQLQQQQQQQQGIRPPSAAQAQAIARAQAQQAQNQILQAAQQMGHNPQQNPQLHQQHMMDQQNGAANFGSPRPPQQAQQRPGLGPERAMQIKNTLIRLTSMNDAQREAQFQQVSNAVRD
jgi:hypothetical protein